jgi:hypothetical protein
MKAGEIGHQVESCLLVLPNSHPAQRKPKTYALLSSCSNPCSINLLTRRSSFRYVLLLLTRHQIPHLLRSSPISPSHLLFFSSLLSSSDLVRRAICCCCGTSCPGPVVRSISTTLPKMTLPKPNTQPPAKQMLYLPGIANSLPSETADFRTVLFTGQYSQ